MKDKEICVQTADLKIVPTVGQDLWNSPWEIFLREGDKEKIGTVTFEGEKQLGTIPIYVEIADGYKNKGYGTQVFKGMVNWAFSLKNIYEITAVTTPDNDKALHALDNAKFVFRRSDGGHVEYSIVKAKSMWTGLYLVIGILVGMALGVVTGNLWVGFGIGVLLCLSLGAVMDGHEARDRAEVTGKRR